MLLLFKKFLLILALTSLYHLGSPVHTQNSLPIAVEETAWLPDGPSTQGCHNWPCCPTLFPLSASQLNLRTWASWASTRRTDPTPELWATSPLQPQTPAWPSENTFTLGPSLVLPTTPNLSFHSCGQQGSLHKSLWLINHFPSHWCPWMRLHHQTSSRNSSLRARRHQNSHIRTSLMAPLGYFQGNLISEHAKLQQLW